MQKAGKERINDFLRNHVCYDLLKLSGKVSLHAPTSGVTMTYLCHILGQIRDVCSILSTLYHVLLFPIGGLEAFHFLALNRMIMAT